MIGTPNLSHSDINSGSDLTSDHLPIIIKFNNIQDLLHKKEKKKHFTKEGWNQYQTELRNTKIVDLNSLLEIANRLKETGKKYFNFDNKENKQKLNIPWWNETRHKIIKNRNKSF